MVGILVFGDNHLIVRGPKPDRATALLLVKHWSLIQVGAETPSALRPWSISHREFREDLEWAVMAPGDGEPGVAVVQLLNELSARGIEIHDSSHHCW